MLKLFTYNNYVVMQPARFMVLQGWWPALGFNEKNKCDEK